MRKWENGEMGKWENGKVDPSASSGTSTNNLIAKSQKLIAKS
jgi:hypothetical protein